MKTKIKKVIFFIILASASLGLSWMITAYNNNLAKVAILNDDFVTNFLGALLALSIATITLLYSTIEKIRDKIANHPQNGKIELTIRSLYNALKMDTWIVFLFLIVIVLAILFRDTNIPYISLPDYLEFSKVDMVFFIKICILFLSFFAVADIILCLFALISVSNRR